MKLHDFISDTIVQIVSGLKEAQLKLGTDASINPAGMTIHPDQLQGRRYDTDSVITEEFIEFDIALTHESGTGTSGGVGVFFGAMNLGSKGQSESREFSMSRVKFRVPVLFPVGPKQKIPFP